ncbi:unnamed protein product [Anisakis simplex]|uniref:Pecanex-like protein n=1 Tax=Anisakis simplex TaxID=6269 RepID=A0A0M3IY56_ANISI|nr:unnamed protein product [Anisakis simplex]
MPCPSAAVEYSPTPQLIAIFIFLVAPIFYLIGCLLIGLIRLLASLVKMIVSKFFAMLYSDSTNPPNKTTDVVRYPSSSIKESDSASSARTSTNSSKESLHRENFNDAADQSSHHSESELENDVSSVEENMTQMVQNGDVHRRKVAKCSESEAAIS